MKRYFILILSTIICLTVFLTGCNKPITLEGKYIFIDNNEETAYVILNKNGTYEMYKSWLTWFENNGESHHYFIGNYKIFQGSNFVNKKNTSFSIIQKRF